MARELLAILTAITLLSAAPALAVAVTPAPLGQPAWSELTPQQRQILAPLARDWNGLDAPRRKKWLGIARRYPAMTPEQQQRIQTQMKPWANLAPEERSAARAKFKKKNKEAPDLRETRRQKWEQYQSLPESEKKKFREKAARKNPSKRPLAHPATPPVPALSGTTAAK